MLFGVEENSCKAFEEWETEQLPVGQLRKGQVIEWTFIDLAERGGIDIQRVGCTHHVVADGPVRIGRLQFVQCPLRQGKVAAGEAQVYHHTVDAVLSDEDVRIEQALMQVILQHIVGHLLGHLPVGNVVIAKVYPPARTTDDVRPPNALHLHFSLSSSGLFRQEYECL